MSWATNLSNVEMCEEPSAAGQAENPVDGCDSVCLALCGRAPCRRFLHSSFAVWSLLIVGL